MVSDKLVTGEIRKELTEDAEKEFVESIVNEENLQIIENVYINKFAGRLITFLKMFEKGGDVSKSLPSFIREFVKEEGYSNLEEELGQSPKEYLNNYFLNNINNFIEQHFKDLNELKEEFKFLNPKEFEKLKKNIEISGDSKEVGETINKFPNILDLLVAKVEFLKDKSIRNAQNKAQELQENILSIQSNREFFESIAGNRALLFRLKDEKTAVKGFSKQLSNLLKNIKKIAVKNNNIINSLKDITIDQLNDVSIDDFIKSLESFKETAKEASEGIDNYVEHLPLIEQNWINMEGVVHQCFSQAETSLRNFKGKEEFKKIGEDSKELLIFLSNNFDKLLERATKEDYELTTEDISLIRELSKKFEDFGDINVFFKNYSLIGKGLDKIKKKRLRKGAKIIEKKDIIEDLGAMASVINAVTLSDNIENVSNLMLSTLEEQEKNLRKLIKSEEGGKITGPIKRLVGRNKLNTIKGELDDIKNYLEDNEKGFSKIKKNIETNINTIGEQISLLQKKYNTFLDNKKGIQSRMKTYTQIMAKAKEAKFIKTIEEIKENKSNTEFVKASLGDIKKEKMVDTYITFFGVAEQAYTDVRYMVAKINQLLNIFRKIYDAHNLNIKNVEAEINKMREWETSIANLKKSAKEIK